VKRRVHIPFLLFCVNRSFCSNEDTHMFVVVANSFQKRWLTIQVNTHNFRFMPICSNSRMPIFNQIPIHSDTETDITTHHYIDCFPLMVVHLGNNEQSKLNHQPEKVVANVLNNWVNWRIFQSSISHDETQNWTEDGSISWLNPFSPP